MKKDSVMVSLFLVFIFVITLSAHFLYVRGYADNVGGPFANVSFAKENFVTLKPYPYASQKECEEANGTKCMLEVCDFLPVGEEYDSACKNRDKKGWFPVAE